MNETFINALLQAAYLRSVFESSLLTGPIIGYYYYKFTGFTPEELLGTDFPHEREEIEKKIMSSRQKSGRK